MHKTNISGNDFESALFREWVEKCGIPVEMFSDDGIVCSREFDFWAPRIVFVLKDVHSDRGFSLRSFLSSGARNEGGFRDGAFTWAPVQRWLAAYGNAVGKQYKIKLGQMHRQDVLRTIAAINLKKTPGGAVNDKDALLKRVKCDHQFLKRQIEGYFDKPTVFVCCGDIVYSQFCQLLALTEAVLNIDGIEFRKIQNGVFAFNVGHHPNKSKRKIHDVRFVRAMQIIKEYIEESAL